MSGDHAGCPASPWPAHQRRRPPRKGPVPGKFPAALHRPSGSRRADAGRLMAAERRIDEFRTGRWRARASESRIVSPGLTARGCLWPRRRCARGRSTRIRRLRGVMRNLPRNGAIRRGNRAPRRRRSGLAQTPRSGTTSRPAASAKRGERVAASAGRTCNRATGCRAVAAPPPVRAPGPRPGRRVPVRLRLIGMRQTCAWRMR